MTDTERLLNEKYGDVKTPAYEADRERLATGEPLAYVIGWQPFLGLKIYLDSHPLIPRSETEWWTEKLLRAAGADFSAAGCPNDSGPEGAKNPHPLRVLDLCAGSGAIGCAALKYLPHAADVYFGEVDPAHEQTILKNIRENGLDATRAHVFIGDLFGPFGDRRFDIIAANPPYIPSDRTLDPSVADHEPALALRSGEDGLDLIRRIALELPKHLTPGGQAWIECDSAHAATACALFRTHGLAAHVLDDQFGAPRVLVVHSLN